MRRSCQLSRARVPHLGLAGPSNLPAAGGGRPGRMPHPPRVFGNSSTSARMDVYTSEPTATSAASAYAVATPATSANSAAVAKAVTTATASSTSTVATAAAVDAASAAAAELLVAADLRRVHLNGRALTSLRPASLQRLSPRGTRKHAGAGAGGRRQALRRSCQLSRASVPHLCWAGPSNRPAAGGSRPGRIPHPPACVRGKLAGRCPQPVPQAGAIPPVHIPQRLGAVQPGCAWPGRA